MGGGGGLMGGAAAAQAGGQAGAAGAVAAQLPQGTDTITSITWQAQSQFFAVAGWDHKAYIVQPQKAQNGALAGAALQQATFNYGAPILDAAWHSAANAVFLAGAAKNVQMWDVQSGKGSVVAQHAAVIRHCKWMSQANMLATSGLDGTIRLWDVRAPKMAAEVPQTLLRERVWAMDVTFPYMTAVTADKQVHMFDLNKGTQAVFRSMKSPLSKQVTCLSMVKHGQQPSFVMGSMEGRVSVRYFDANLDKSKKKFSMKAHRTKQDGTTASDGTIIYPVHTVEFFTNAQFGSCFLTGGGDGSFSVWDKDRMSRPMHCPGLGLPVTASGFSPDGSMLAVALGNDWLKGAAASMQVQQPTQVRVQPITAASLSGTS